MQYYHSAKLETYIFSHLQTFGIEGKKAPYFNFEK